MININLILYFILKIMGSISSSSKDNNNTKVCESQDDNSYDFELKSENSIKNFEKNQSTNVQSEISDNSILLDLKENKIPYKFEWRQGGKIVKIAGSFLNNWKEQIEMKKNINTGFFEIELNITKGIHQFKFIVDKKWECSSNYLTTKDKNNINNIIDLTNYNPNKKLDDSKFLSCKGNKKDKKKSIKTSIEYNCNYPNINDINDDAPAIPFHYINSFDLNNSSKQDNLYNHLHKYLQYNNSKNKLENNNFKTIMTISHEKISHLCNSIQNYNNDNKTSYTKLSITQRNKHKFLTYIYYTPKSEV